MCGILARVSRKPIQHASEDYLLQSLNHRGPDSYSSETFGRFYLGHTRLEIVGIGESGQQPFKSSDGRWSLIYNGEIYNHLELTRELELRVPFDCDGRVIPEILSRYGIAGLKKLRGMFAIIAVDNFENRIIAAVDSFGMKPLNFARFSEGIVFSSEARTLLPTLDSRRIDLQALAQLLNFGFMLPNQSGIEGVTRLTPGQVIVFDERLNQEELQLEIHDPVETKNDWAKVADSLVESIDSHFLSDLPVSIFLSNGFDSSALAVAAKRLGRNPELICVTNAINSPSNIKEIRNFARKLNFKIHFDNYRVDEEVLNHFFQAMDRPSLDGLNTFLISKSAHEKGFKVALSGLGADEFLGGYMTNKRFQLMQLTKGLPHKSRIFMLSLLKQMSFEKSEERLEAFRGLNSKSTQQEIAFAFTAALRSINSKNRIFEILKIKSANPMIAAVSPLHEKSPADYLIDFNLRHYLAGCLLADADIYSMTNSLELRMPYIDKRFLSSLLGVPNRKLSKVPLAEALDDEYLLELARRPKESFSLPLGEIVDSRIFPRINATDSELSPFSSFLYSECKNEEQFLKFSNKWQTKWILTAVDQWMVRNGLYV